MAGKKKSWASIGVISGLIVQCIKATIIHTKHTRRFENQIVYHLTSKHGVDFEKIYPPLQTIHEA
jgi:hypothetical protein